MHGGQKCMQILPNETRGPLIKATSKITCYGRNQSDTRKVLRHTQDVNKRNSFVQKPYSNSAITNN